MKHNVPSRQLREHPDLDQLKRQGKELLQAFLAGEADAVAEVQAHYRASDPATFALHDALLVLARSHGFESWPKLKAYVDGVTIKRLAGFVRAGDLAEVRAMLNVRPELANMQMSYGDEHRPLHFAVLNRLPEMVRLLMASGADARKGIHPHRDATTAYTMAKERGFDEIVAIIEDEEQRRREAMSATACTVSSAQDDLTEAIASGDDARAIAALEAHVPLVQGSDREGWTPLHIAAGVRSVPVTSWLLQHGADPNRRGKDGRTPLDLAAGSRRPLDAQQFTAVAGLLRQAGAELTARAAVALGDADWLRARHAEGALTNPLTYEAGGLLSIAVRHDRRDVLALLLQFGFDPDERVRGGGGDSVYYTQGLPLWQAAALGRRELVETLLEGGADPNADVDSSGSAVFSAYSHRQWEIVDLLRQHGGVVGAGTAAIYRQTELARQMLADDDQGKLPKEAVGQDRPLAVDLLDYANSGGDPEIVRMALERIDWPRDDLRWSFFLSRSLDFWNHIPWLSLGNKELDRGTYIQCFRQVLARCNPNVLGGFERTALHEVAAAGDHVTDEEAVPFATALLDAGARTDIRDQILKSTPLGWACRWGRVAVAKVLLERGADLIEADAEPWARPRAWAEKMGHAGVLAVLAMFRVVIAAVALAGVAFTQERVSFPTTDDGLIYADVYGRGDRGIVLVHGGRFNKESWRKQAEVLAQAGFRVMAIDLRGYGQSRGPGQADVFTAPLHLDVLAAVRHLRSAGAKSIALVGGSLGGGAAARAVIDAPPGQIERLLLLGSSPDGPPEKLKGRKLFIVARDDANAGGPRLPGIRAAYDKAPQPKELIVVDGSAHAQFLFESDQGERVMREILRFLTAP